MEYRRFETIPEKVSLLGLGGMRFPVLDDQPDQVIEEGVQALVDHAVSRGITYFDTAYSYHGGRSEEVLTRALSKYQRDTYYLADKLPIWLIQEEGDTERYFYEQLKRCRTEYFDFYLVHSLDRLKYAICEKYRVFDKLKKLQAEGKIRHLGFSFHDTPELLEKIVTDHRWDFAQIQLNYLDWEMQDAKGQYEILVSHGLPCVVMEPSRGGALISLPESSAKFLKEVHPEASTGSWAIRFAASKPGVLCVLSGMESEDIIDDNAAAVTGVKPFDRREQQAVGQAVESFMKNKLIPCTGCAYCRECPKQVNIPKIFAAYNQYLAGRDNFQFYNAYSKLKPEERAVNCVKCGKCMERCPQSIPITDNLATVQKLAEKINGNRPSNWEEL